MGTISVQDVPGLPARDGGLWRRPRWRSILPVSALASGLLLLLL